MIQIDFTTPRMYTYDDDVWLVDELAEAHAGYDELHFSHEGRAVTLRRTGAGFFEGEEGRFVYRGVRGECESHVLVAGNWIDNGHEGPFVLVVPKTLTH